MNKNANFETDAVSLASSMSIRFLALRRKDGALKLFRDLGTGKLYASGLFKLHDEIGFPLSFSLGECRKRGWEPCLMQFKADAIRAGWSPVRAERVIREAKADA